MPAATASVCKWLFGLYGISGSIYPAIMILDRTDLRTLRWPVETTYLIVWTVQLINYAARTGARFIGARTASGSKTTNTLLNGFVKRREGRGGVG